MSEKILGVLGYVLFGFLMFTALIYMWIVTDRLDKILEIMEKAQ